MKKREVDMAKRSARKMALYQQVFSGPEGQEVLYDLMASHYILDSTFDEGNIRKTLIREGERNAVLRILKILKMDVKAMHERIKLHELSAE